MRRFKTLFFMALLITAICLSGCLEQTTGTTDLTEQQKPDANNADFLNGHNSNYFINLFSNIDQNIDSNNASFLGGFPASYFYPASNPNGYISSYIDTNWQTSFLAFDENIKANFVPYQGATKDVNIADNTLIALVIRSDKNTLETQKYSDIFDGSTTANWTLGNGITVSSGKMRYNGNEGSSTATLDFFTPEANTYYKIQFTPDTIGINYTWLQNGFLGGSDIGIGQYTSDTPFNAIIKTTNTDKLQLNFYDDGYAAEMTLDDLIISKVVYSKVDFYWGIFNNVYTPTIDSIITGGTINSTSNFTTTKTIQAGTSYKTTIGDISSTNVQMVYSSNSAKFRFYQKFNTDGTISSNINASDSIDDTTKSPMKLSLDPSAARMALQIAPIGTTSWTNNWFAPFYVKQSGNVYFNVIDTAKVGRSIWGQIQTADDGRSILNARGDINFNNGSLTVGNGKDMNKSLGIGDANIQGTLYANVLQANTFVDTTPAFNGTTKEALKGITSISSKTSPTGTKEIDHETLPEFAKEQMPIKEIYEEGEECYILPDTDKCNLDSQKRIEDCSKTFSVDYCFEKEKTENPDCKTTKTTCIPIKKERIIGYTDARDIGAIVTLQIEAIKELQKQNEDLNKAITKICTNSPLSCR